MYEAIFGSPTAEKVLLYIQNYGEGHANGIAKTFKTAPSQVHKQLIRLEKSGILVGKTAGRTHTFIINPRLAIKAELSSLLERILSLVPDDQKAAYFRQRTRPRRTGKKL